MKTILVISDSHGKKSNIEWLINNEKFDYLFFLGDGIKDLEEYECDARILKVAGNCDLFSIEAKQKIVVIENVKIMLTHGHLYKAKLTLGVMINEAIKLGAQAVCFGHTHSQLYENIDGITLINPGSLANGSYAQLIINNGQIQSLTSKNLY